jgi:hypothetical protein
MVRGLLGVGVKPVVGVLDAASSVSQVTLCARVVAMNRNS